MRYIARIDSGATHCYLVRIGFNIKSKKVRTFSDGVFGGQPLALLAAKKWRNQQLKILLPKMAKEYNYDINNQRHWGEGVSKSLDRRVDPPRLSIVASYWDGNNMKQLNKTFSVNKYGMEEAVALAKQWRNLKLTGEL